MNKNDLTETKQDLDLFEIALIAWNTKWISISIIATSLILGAIICLLAPSLTMKRTESVASVNVLIEDVPIFNKIEIAGEINSRFRSSYNYESWTTNNSKLTYLLPQSFATTLNIMETRHTVNFNYRNKEHLNAILSFVEHTMINHSKILEGTIKASQIEEIKILKEKIDRRKEEQYQNYKYRLLEIDNEITNRSIELVGAKEELAFIEKEIAERPEFKQSGMLMIRLLDLTNAVNVESLIIENLKIRRDNYKRISEEMDGQLQALTIKLEGLEKDLLKKNEIIKIGKVSTSVIAPYKPKFILIMLVSFVIGLILSIIYIMIKLEYDQRQLLKKS